MMSDDLALVASAVRGLLARHSDDGDAWDALVADGWHRLLVDDEASGMPAAVVAVCELARVTRCAPLLGGMAASATLAEHGGDPEGPLTVGIDASKLDDSIAFTLLDGRADSTVVVGPIDGKLLLARAGLRAGENPCVDLTRVITRVQVPAGEHQELTDVSASVERHLTRIALLLAADALGAVEGAVDRTIEYSRDREVFGAPLASFQVVQHRLVDMLLAARLGRRLVDKAAARAATTERALLAWSAKSFLGEQGPWVTGEAIQLHGGMGFSWESGMHRFLRRVEADRVLLGGPSRAASETLRHARSHAGPAVTDFLLRPGSEGPGA